MKNKGKRLFSPALWATLLIIILAALLLSYVLVRGDKSALAYFSYLFATYALAVGIGGLVRVCRTVRITLRTSRLSQTLRKNAIVAQYLDDPIFRTKLALYLGTLINLAYAIIKLISGLLYRSIWLVVFSLYYMVLIGLRLSLVHHIRHYRAKEDMIGEYRRYRLTGILLMLMNVVLSLIVARMIGHKEAYDYPGPLIYVIAAYTFYAIIIAIINVFRFRQHGSPVYSAVKVVNLTSAIVAMLSLSGAMITRFGGEDNLFRAKMLGISGFVAFLVILSMSIYLIANATKQIRLLEDA